MIRSIPLRTAMLWAWLAALLPLSASGVAHADDSEVSALRKQVDTLGHEVEALKGEIDQPSHRDLPRPRR